MIGQVAAITKNMRIGSGGVMLPNHAPLMVMERFKVLEALFPGRIDLGLGRAPGTDQITSLALRRRQDTSNEQDDFLDRFQEMILFETQRLSGQPSVLEGRRDADRRAAAADLAARLQRLFGRARRACRRGIFLRASFLGFSARSPDADLPQPVQAVGVAADALRDPRRRGDLRRHRSRGRPHGDERGPAFRAPRRSGNTARSHRPRKPPPIRTRRSTASASRTIASG